MIMSCRHRHDRAEALGHRALAKRVVAEAAQLAFRGDGTGVRRSCRHACGTSVLSPGKELQDDVQGLTSDIPRRGNHAEALEFRSLAHAAVAKKFAFFVR